MEDRPTKDLPQKNQKNSSEGSDCSIKEIDKQKPISFDLKHILELDLLPADKRQEADTKEYLDLRFNQLEVDNKFGKLLVYYENTLFVFGDLALKEEQEHNYGSLKMDSLLRKPTRIELKLDKMFSTEDFLIFMSGNKVKAFNKRDFYAGSRSNPKLEFEMEDPTNIQVIENRLVFREKKEIVSLDLNSEEKACLHSEVGESSKFAVNNEYIAYNIGKDVFLKKLSDGEVKKSKFTHKEIHKMGFAQSYLCLINMTKPNLVMISIDEFDGESGYDISGKIDDSEGIEEVMEERPDVDFTVVEEIGCFVVSNSFSIQCCVLDLKEESAFINEKNKKGSLASLKTGATTEPTLYGAKTVKFQLGDYHKSQMIAILDCFGCLSLFEALKNDSSIPLINIENKIEVKESINETSKGPADENEEEQTVCERETTPTQEDKEEPTQEDKEEPTQEDKEEPTQEDKEEPADETQNQLIKDQTTPEEETEKKQLTKENELEDTESQIISKAKDGSINDFSFLSAAHSNQKDSATVKEGKEDETLEKEDQLEENKIESEDKTNQVSKEEAARQTDSNVKSVEIEQIEEEIQEEKEDSELASIGDALCLIKKNFKINSKIEPIEDIELDLKSFYSAEFDPKYQKVMLNAQNEKVANIFCSRKYKVSKTRLTLIPKKKKLEITKEIKDFSILGSENIFYNKEFKMFKISELKIASRISANVGGSRELLMRNNNLENLLSKVKKIENDRMANTKIELIELKGKTANTNPPDGKIADFQKIFDNFVNSTKKFSAGFNDFHYSIEKQCLSQDSAKTRNLEKEAELVEEMLKTLRTAKNSEEVLKKCPLLGERKKRIDRLLRFEQEIGSWMQFYNELKRKHNQLEKTIDYSSLANRMSKYNFFGLRLFNKGVSAETKVSIEDILNELKSNLNSALDLLGGENISRIESGVEYLNKETTGFCLDVKNISMGFKRKTNQPTRKSLYTEQSTRRNLLMRKISDHRFRTQIIHVNNEVVSKEQKKEVKVVMVGKQVEDSIDRYLEERKKIENSIKNSSVHRNLIRPAEEAKEEAKPPTKGLFSNEASQIAFGKKKEDELLTKQLSFNSKSIITPPEDKDTGSKEKPTENTKSPVSIFGNKAESSSKIPVSDGKKQSVFSSKTQDNKGTGSFLFNSKKDEPKKEESTNNAKTENEETVNKESSLNLEQNTGESNKFNLTGKTNLIKKGLLKTDSPSKDQIAVLNTSLGLSDKLKASTEENKTAEIPSSSNILAQPSKGITTEGQNSSGQGLSPQTKPNQTMSGIFNQGNAANPANSLVTSNKTVSGIGSSQPALATNIGQKPVGGLNKSFPNNNQKTNMAAIGSNLSNPNQSSSQVGFPNLSLGGNNATSMTPSPSLPKTNPLQINSGNGQPPIKTSAQFGTAVMNSSFTAGRNNQKIQPVQFGNTNSSFGVSLTSPAIGWQVSGFGANQSLASRRGPMAASQPLAGNTLKLAGSNNSLSGKTGFGQVNNQGQTGFGQAANQRGFGNNSNNNQGGNDFFGQ